MRHSLLALPLFASLALGNQACGLISADFEGQVKIAGNVDDPDKEYFDIKNFNPDSNEDYQKNKDRIHDGRLDWLEIEFTAVPNPPENPADCTQPNYNCATLVVGQVDVRRAGAGEGDWITGVSSWEGVQVATGNKIRLTMPPEIQDRIDTLVFEEGGDLEFRLNGIADQGRVKFDWQVVVNLIFSASL